MTPVLYAATERQFIDNGLGTLGELYSAEVVEKRNGELEFTAYYPVTGRHYDDIKQDRIILAKPNPRDDPHAFRIVSAELDIAGQSLEIIADSITNDLAGSLITGLDITDLNGDDAMHQIHDAMTVDVGIEMDSDIQTKSSTSFKYVNPLEAVAGTTGSILQIWGGEMKRENDRLSMLKRRGYDNVTTFRLGKNIKGLTYTVDASSLVTRVYPYWHGQLDSDTTDSSTEHEDTYVSGAVIDSPEIGKYSHVYIKPVDVTQEIKVPQGASTADIKKLVDEWTKNWFTQSANTDIDKPKVTLDITPLDLQSSTDYADKLAVLETLGLTDSVTVYVPEYGVDVTAVVNELHYDPLLEQTTEIVAGTAKVSFAENNANTLSTVQSQLAAVATQADAAAISADGKSTNYYGDQPPVGATDGDYWFYSDVNGEGIKQLQNGTWVIIVDTNLPKQLETQMVAASAATSAAVVTANSAADKASLAAQSVAAVSADLTIAQSVAEQARSSATDAAMSGATAMSNAATALSLASGATVKATSVGASVDSLTGAIQLKADQSVVDGLSKSVSSASAELTVQAGQIAIKADSTTVNSLAGTVSSQGTKIAAQADSLALTVSKSDLTNSLAGYATQAYTQAQVTAASDQIQSTVSAVQDQVELVGQTNLAYNSSFADNMEGWDNPQKAFYYTDSNWGDPQYSAMGAGVSTTGKGDGDFFWLGSKLVPIAANGVASASARLVFDTSQLPTLAQVTIRFFDAAGTQTSYKDTFASIKTASTTAFIQTLKLDGVKADASATQMQMLLAIRGNGHVLFKNPMLVTASYVGAYQQSTTALATQSQVSTVTQTVKALQATVADKASTSQLTQLSDQLTSTIQATGQKNLVYNALFENDFEGWTFSNNSTKSGYYYTTSTWGDIVQPVGGLENNVATNAAGTNCAAYSKNMPITPLANSDAQYSCSVRIKYSATPVPDRISATIQFTDDAGNQTSYKDGIAYATSPGKFLTIGASGATPDAKATHVRIVLGFRGNAHIIFKNPMLVAAPTVGAFVPDNASSTQITQLQDDINLRVKSGDVISQINLDKSGILIDGAKNHITGQTTIDNGVIKDAMIDSLSASKITAGTINAAVARIINLDVSSLVGDKTSFVQSAWNSISGYVHVDANGVRIGQGSGVLLLQSDGMHVLDSYNGEDVGFIHANSIVNHPAYNGLNFELNRLGDYMGWSYRRDDTSNYTLALSYWPAKISELDFQKGLNLNDDMWINTDKTLYLRKIGTWNYTNASSQYFTIEPFTMSGVSYPMISAGGTAGIFIGDDSIYMRWKNGIYNMWDVIHSIGRDQVWN